MEGWKPITVPLVFLTVLALAGGALAQTMPAQHIQFVEINVKAGAQGQFEEYVKKINEAADKVGAPQGWIFAQPAVGASGPTYYVVLEFDKWSERDSWEQIPQLLTKAFGEAEAKKLMKVGGESTWGSESRVYSLDEERSWNLDKNPPAPAPYYTIMRGKVKPDMVDEYQMVISKIKEAQENAPVKRAGIRRRARFGPSWEFYSATPLSKWADLDEQGNLWENVAKTHGETEARLLRQTLQSCYEEREFIVIATRPDLSRQAPSETSNE